MSEQPFSSSPEQPKPAEKYTLDYIRQLILESPQKMDDEQKRTNQGDLACLSTRLQAILSTLELGQHFGSIEEETVRAVMGNVDKLTKKVNQLRQTYPGDARLPAEVKAELISELNVLLG